MKKLLDVANIHEFIQPNDRLLVGGFGATGTPLTILDEIAQSPSIKDLEIVSNNLGDDGFGLDKVFHAGKIKKAIGSFFTLNRGAVLAWSRGELEIELVPQGTLAEAIRAGGAGIGGFYTKTGVGTEIAEDKETRIINGEKYLFEEAIRGRVAIIKAYQADRFGNLIYNKTARNFNPLMVTAADVTIVEVEEIVDTIFDPEIIVTPHIYVDHIVQSKYVRKGGTYQYAE